MTHDDQPIADLSRPEARLDLPGEILRYGAARAAERGLAPGDGVQLVDDMRAREWAEFASSEMNPDPIQARRRRAGEVVIEAIEMSETGIVARGGIGRRRFVFRFSALSDVWTLSVALEPDEDPEQARLGRVPGWFAGPGIMFSGPMDETAVREIIGFASTAFLEGEPSARWMTAFFRTPEDHA